MRSFLFCMFAKHSNNNHVLILTTDPSLTTDLTSDSLNNEILNRSGTEMGSQNNRIDKTDTNGNKQLNFTNTPYQNKDNVGQLERSVHMVLKLNRREKQVRPKKFCKH